MLFCIYINIAQFRGYIEKLKINFHSSAQIGGTNSSLVQALRGQIGGSPKSYMEYFHYLRIRRRTRSVESTVYFTLPHTVTVYRTPLQLHNFFTDIITAIIESQQVNGKNGIDLNHIPSGIV